MAPGSPRDGSAEDRYDELYEHAPCGHLSMRVDGSVVRVNETLLTWLGRDRDAVVGGRFQDLLAPGGRIYFETHFRPLLLGERRAREIAFDLQRGDGTRVPVLVSAVLDADGPDGADVCRVALFEATDRRTYERELVDARRRAEASEARARTLAETLQESLLPHALPDIERVELAARFRPAGDGTAIGGDFYDVFETARHHWMIVVGDVCGKGANAATVTALARYTIRAAAMRARRPRHVLTTLNDALLQQHIGRFCTVSCARIRTGGPDATAPVRVTVASGGHPLPYVVTERGVRAVGRHGTLLGAFPDVRLHDSNVELSRGDQIIWYTDGVTEARGRHGEFGDEGVQQALAATAGLPADTVAEHLVRTVTDVQEGPPRDDIAVVVLRVT